jgi:uncharacterized delta-60 repeat protein
MKLQFHLSVLALGLACVVSITSVPVQAAPGDLDPTFGTDGKVITDFAGHDDGSGGVAIQSDGKIVVAGFAATSDTPDTDDFALARYNNDGTLDTSFGTGGKVTTDFGAADDVARKVALQADGKIVVVGLHLNGTESAFALARYTTSGKLDQSFGQGGKVLTTFPGMPANERSRFIVIQVDQKILIGGNVGTNQATGPDFALARYNPDGSLDQTFGDGGLVTTNISSTLDNAWAAVVQSSGKIVVGGFSLIFDVSTQTSTSEFSLVRYKSNGTVDTTFGTDGTGVVLTEFSGDQANIVDLALGADESIIALGTDVPDFNPGPIDRFVLAKYSADGILDSTFGDGGRVVTHFRAGSSDDASALLLQPDGRIIVSGSTVTANGDRDFAFARYDSDGTLDASFGVDGLLTTAISTGDDSANGLALQPDGRLVVAGSGGVNPNFAVARYETGLVATKALNLSTRADVGIGDNVLIGGFIITGGDPEKVLLRAIGPSLSLGGTAVLADPVLELHKSDGTIVTNDNWKDTQQAAIIATGIPPKDDLESAIVATLDPGAYTAIVHGKNSGSGVGLVELYDLGGVSGTQLANVSSRSFVQTGDDVMIGGFIIGGVDNATVVVRGLGPSLSDMNVTNALADPTLQIVDANGAEIAFNDNWKDSQETELRAAHLAPSNDLEAAVLLDLAAGAYTAVLRGRASTTGVGLVEVYNLP